ETRAAAVRFRGLCDGAANCCGLCGQDKGTALPRRASRNMVGSANARRINAMNAPLTVLAAPGNLASAMCAIGRDARSASHALALAPAARKNDALAGMAKALRPARAAMLA